jgi:uncharacterized protein YbaP (TraB family)
MRIISILALCCMAPFILVAQEKQSSAKETSNEDLSNKTVLWEISGNGLEQPSYLFGTMHILCAEDAQLSDSLLYAIGASSQVYFEIDMDNMAEMMGIFRYIRMNDNKKLSDLLSPAEYDRVKKYFSENKTILPLAMMERFKPYFIASLLSESKMPCESRKGMEEVILQQAKKMGKPINGLESMAFQASIFDSIPYKDQARDLLRTIDSASADDSSTRKLVEVYRSQDLKAIESITLQEEGGVATYLDLFLYGRNAKWIPEMVAAMKKGPSIFAVGAAHLPGDKGVIQLLRKAGYNLRPVKNQLHQQMAIL